MAQERVPLPDPFPAKLRQHPDHEVVQIPYADFRQRYLGAFPAPKAALEAFLFRSRLDEVDEHTRLVIDPDGSLFAHAEEAYSPYAMTRGKIAEPFQFGERFWINRSASYGAPETDGVKSYTHCVAECLAVVRWGDYDGDSPAWRVIGKRRNYVGRLVTRGDDLLGHNLWVLTRGRLQIYYDEVLVR